MHKVRAEFKEKLIQGKCGKYLRKGVLTFSYMTIRKTDRHRVVITVYAEDDTPLADFVCYPINLGKDDTITFETEGKMKIKIY